MVQQQPSAQAWNQQSNVAWTHEAQKPFINDPIQTEQRVILTSVDNNDRPVPEEHITVPDEQVVPVIPRDQNLGVPEQRQDSQVVPVVQQTPEVEESKVVVVPQIAKIEAELNPEPAEKKVNTFFYTWAVL